MNFFLIFLFIMNMHPFTNQTIQIPKQSKLHWASVAKNSATQPNTYPSSQTYSQIFCLKSTEQPTYHLTFISKFIHKFATTTTCTNTITYYKPNKLHKQIESSSNQVENLHHLHRVLSWSDAPSTAQIPVHFKFLKFPNTHY